MSNGWRWRVMTEAWETTPERGARGSRGRPLLRDDGGESADFWEMQESWIRTSGWR